MHCGNCGTVLREQAKFCDNCGTAVKTQEASAPADISVLCPGRNNINGTECLKPLKRSEKACLYCGWEINPIIFQPGSRSCTKQFSDGSFCDGIVCGDSSLCTKCVQTVLPHEKGQQNTKGHSEGMDNTNNGVQDRQGETSSEEPMEIEQDKWEPLSYKLYNPMQNQRADLHKASVVSECDNKSTFSSLAGQAFEQQQQTEHEADLVEQFSQDEKLSSTDNITTDDSWVTDDTSCTTDSERETDKSDMSTKTSYDSNEDKYMNNNQLNIVDDTNRKRRGANKDSNRGKKSKVDRQKKKMRKEKSMDKKFPNRSTKYTACSAQQVNIAETKGAATFTVGGNVHRGKFDLVSDSTFAADENVSKKNPTTVNVEVGNTILEQPVTAPTDDNTKNSMLDSKSRMTKSEQVQVNNTDPVCGIQIPSTNTNNDQVTKSEASSTDKKDNHVDTKGNETDKIGPTTRAMTAAELQSASGDTDEDPSMPQNGSQKQLKTVAPQNQPNNCARPPHVDEHQDARNSVEVIFHSIVSPSLLRNSKDPVFIHLNGIQPSNFQAKLVKVHKHDYAEFVTTTTLPLSSDIAYRGLSYSYFVHSKDGDTCEYVYDAHGMNNYRILRISEEEKKKAGILHRYDGVIDVAPETILSNIPYIGNHTKSKMVKKNAGRTFHIFFEKHLDELQKGNSIADEFLENIETLVHGLKSVYFVKAGLWSSHEDFDKFIQSKLKPYLQKLDEQNRKSGGKPSLVIAVVVTHLLVEHCIPYQRYHWSKNLESNFAKDSEFIGHLCEQMMVKPLGEHETMEEIDNLKKQLQTKKKQVIENLQLFVNKISHNSGNVSWLFCVPLLHFLQEKCKPYQKPPSCIQHTKEKPEWWGVEEYQGAQKFFEGKSRWTMSTEDLIQKLQPMFIVDYLLPRTLMTVLKFEDLQKDMVAKSFPEDAFLARLYYELVKKLRDKKNYQMMENCLLQISKIMDVGSSVDNDVQDCLINLYRTFVIGNDLLQAALKHYPRESIETCIVHAAAIVIKALAFYDSIRKEKEHKDLVQFDKNHSEIFEVCMKELSTWLTTNFHIHSLDVFKKSLKIWNDLLSMELPKGNIQLNFTANLKECLESSITKKMTNRTFMMTQLVDIYCHCFDKFGTTIQEILTKLALKAVIEGSLSNLGLDQHSADRYGTLLIRAIEKQWIGIKDEELFVKTLQWPPLEHFLQMFYSEKRSEMLDPDCLNQLITAVSMLQGKLNMLNDGSIVIKDLLLISENFEKFEKLLTIIYRKDEKEEKCSNMKPLLQLREKEYEKYQSVYQDVVAFLHLCSRIKVDVTQIQRTVSDLKEPDNIGLHTLCHSENPNIKDGDKPKVVAFDLDDETLVILPDILQYKESSVFIANWEHIGNAVVKKKGRKISIEETIEEVWHPLQERLNIICQQMKSGKMLFQEFENIFNGIEEKQLRFEFQLMSRGDTHWIDQRLTQIYQYRELQDCVAGARVIMKFVDSYGLKGNFDPVRLMTNVKEDSALRMEDINASMIDACSILKGFTSAHVTCLEEFISSKPLILWLRKSMPSGLKELKVFVDLASISAGEGDMELAKVQCLHAATTGYAPLIFNLNEDIDYTEFLQKCENVWKELQVDKKLPKKLKDACRHLAWLKTVEKAHGSVEVTSLAQAKAINSSGIYRVGKLEDFEGIKPALKDVLTLHMSEEEQGKILTKTCRHEQLNDIQSRLMLVAGKAEKIKDDVDRFTMILDSVVRLGNVYTKLLSAGCILFYDWRAKIFCERTRPACCIITFGKDKDCQKLKGRNKFQQDEVCSIVPRIARFMENCLTEWLQYINEKRDRYYHLNFFTIDQMVILQKELVKIGTDKKPSDLIFPLLSAVKKDCSLQDIVEAMKEAQQQVETLDHKNEENMHESADEEDMKINMSEEVFVNELMQAGYTEALAREALQHFSPDDVDEAIIWCVGNADGESKQEDTKVPDDEADPTDDEKNAQSFSFHGWTSNQETISTLTTNIVGELSQINQEVSVADLIKGLNQVWETFLSSVSSSVSDYLSVEHLGLILQKLAEREEFPVEREFLKCFRVGVPNLIICPQDDLLHTVLTVYMHDAKQPLPQPDEVLICSSHTTLDQLDTFWRRAVFATSGRIHCLVNGDLLDYDVSDKGDQCLEQHMEKAKDKGIDYRLVVLCSTENEYKSRIVAALDRFRRPHLPVANCQAIRQYLQNQFRVDNITGKVVPAAKVDFDLSTVRVVKSWRAGVGKTLYKKRLEAELNRLYSTVGRKSEAVVTIPLHETEIDVDDIMSRLLECTLQPGHVEPRIFHIDISHEVYVGVDAFLFHLLILGCLSNSAGYVWRKSPHDHYLVETMPRLSEEPTNHEKGGICCIHCCFDILPDVICRSPEESLNILKNVKKPSDLGKHDRLFDHEEFCGPVFQRPYQYLKHLDEKRSLSVIDPNKPQGDEINCLQILLRHCGISDPSWAELKHFVWFLNTQLQDFEVSAFCGPAAREDLPGFANFVLRFLIQMSRDFATRSLKISETSPERRMQTLPLKDEKNKENDKEEELLQMRRTWESSPHPYIFFNPDRNTMTFLGFNIDRKTGNLVDHQTKTVLERAIMDKNLYRSLRNNRVDINENFDALTRGDKIQKLCSVMGMDMPYDPDETYELTTDNVKKILAIYMRFKCDIPVIIMGETGCGKTRLVKFMCSLQCPPGVSVQNMILMKVHGGTKRNDIIKKVEDAEKIAKENSDKYGQHLQTVLFFDEANTTEAIGLIKEIMCDKTLGGKPLKLCQSLKIIAACNPYRKHTDELIKRLEQAGLGYHVDAVTTVDRLGRIPMRRLVYRVQPLPQSLLPLVWDFGQLDTRVEELYIKQMVLRYIKNSKLPQVKDLATVLSHILMVSQDFMRRQKDECSFVSLRDVERVLEVMSWFYRQANGSSSLFQMLSENDAKAKEDEHQNQSLSCVTRSLILALGVCYHACLKKREAYRETVARHFADPCPLPGGADRMLQEIERCQDVFLSNVQLGKNIAQNQALKENVFMMVTCIELRIPLFLVGKPGSSKSLAKTIVADAMQGHAAHKQLFREYKAVQMVSFQCSPLSVPEGIVGTFRQCAKFQKDRDLERFVSVVVLDEVGLAEDSPRMPLKTLHPLLEDGCEGDEKPKPYMKVAFIGISNWALDPAKMNRGILVQREVPELKELTQSAEGICSEDQAVLTLMKPLIENLAQSYLDLFKEALKKLREFFGLRDFYSLLKMVYAFADKNKKKPSWKQLEHAILRNFGGMEGINPVTVFARKLTTVNICERPSETDPDCTPAGLIQACLEEDGTESESRYLLLLTENYGALNILQQKILKMHNAITIFGSSFPSDLEYTQICRNINRIKVCMETGSTVILLNLENLYESLYDALNQYYVEFGGERFVDLGLGSHRVKCKVHKQFRLIVVAEKQTVYDKFPIPLINRLEKHFLNISTMLTPVQLKLAEKLKSWAKDFAKIETYFHGARKKSEFSVSEVFMGYHADMCAAVVLQVTQEQHINTEVEDQKILEQAQEWLLWSATPDSVMRLPMTPLKKWICDIYFKEQHHESLVQYLLHRRQKCTKYVLAQITTHSKLLTTVDLGELSKDLEIPLSSMVLLTLQSFDTEQQFSRQIRSFLENGQGKESLLVVQSDCGDQNSSLVDYARYCIQDELQEIGNSSVHVVFIIQLPRISAGCFSGFQCGLWHSLHIDDLRPQENDTLTVLDMQEKSIGMLIHDAVTTEINMEDADKSEIHMFEMFSSMDLDKTPEDNYMIDEHSQMFENDQIEIVKSDIQVNTAPNEMKSHHRLNVHSLIFNCIPSALAMVKDTEELKPRKTERVALMLEPLQTGHMGETEMIFGLAKHLDLLLQEKEKTSVNPKNWLSEAAQAENINTAGTFRRSWMQCIEAKVTPILAGIIAFIDTNSNLDCLSRSAPDSWRHQLWMEVINCPQATGMQYNTQLVSPGRSAEVTEVMVSHTGAEGHLFIGDLPFSWLIFRLIEDTIKTSYTTTAANELGSTDVIMKTRDVVISTSLGEVLQPILVQNVQETTQAYLSDFVHMVYPVKTLEEHKLVCESLYTVTRSLLEAKFGDAVAQMIGFHVSHHIYAQRLKTFSSLNTVWPDCSQAIVDFGSKSLKSYLFTEEEMTLDVIGLKLLLLELVPKKGLLNDTKGRDKWLRKVHLYRPVVERMMDFMRSSRSSPGSAEYGALCRRGIQEAKLNWTSVVVIKLFVEHVCSMDDSGEDNFVTRVMSLWTLLKAGVDMKKMESLGKVETFLKICNTSTASKLFEISKGKKCEKCDAPFEGPPVTLLPCKDTICTACWNEIKTAKDVKCPVCIDNISEDFVSAQQKKDAKRYAKYNDYKKRCNSFFIEVVSQLCFADGTAPDSDVVEKLMKYITRETKSQKVVTKEMSIFDDDIDPTPVLRSFLLQLLLRSSGQQVHQYLKKYMEQAYQFFDVKSAGNRDYTELCLLIIQCIEDSYHQQISKCEEQEDKEVFMAINMLRNARDVVGKQHTSSSDLRTLEALAGTRFSLIVVAKYVQEIFIVKSRKINQTLRHLIDAAAQLCQECGTKWPCIFFIKQLCRRYGKESYEVVSNSDNPMCRWMRMLNLDRDKKLECSDNYIVCGQQYLDLREMITKCLSGENVNCLEKKLKVVQGQDWQKRIWLLLAIHREITMLNVYPENRHLTMQKAVEPVIECLKKCQSFKGEQWTHVEKIIENSVWRHCDRLNINQGLSLHDQGICCLLVHALITFYHLPGEKTLLQPLKSLALQPESMVTAFLPTMPQDDVIEMKEALLQGRSLINLDENPVFYRCPNGHPYVIGDCGRPTSTAFCKECGAKIGGRNYKLIAGNVLDAGKDKTQPGHILGRAERRTAVAQPERTMSPVGCAIIRLLTHIAMILGANENLQAIRSMITPKIKKKAVHEFLLSHIKLDITVIQKKTGCSPDDVVLLIHILLRNMTNTRDEGFLLSNLTSKHNRSKWEEMFTDRYIAPLLKKLNQDLGDNNRLIAGDKRLGSDHLMSLLHEVDTNYEEDANHIHEVPAVWRYRKQISMDHLTSEFHSQISDRCKILQLFLKEEQQLRALRLVPSIMRLQKLLIQKYQRKLDRAVANTDWSLAEVITDFKKDGKEEEMKQLIFDFGEAWNCIRDSLATFPCPTVDGIVTVPREYCCRQISMDTNVSMLLPSHKDDGMCSYALLYYLLMKQNSFLDKYCEAKQQKTEDLPKVKVADITPAHLISYHPDRDILSIVLANCNYSFEVGQGTTITYDFQNIERQLMDRFLFSKSYIEIDEIELMTFRSDATNSAVFASLRRKIKQEQLGAAVRRQICEEFRSSLPEICNCLDNLDITISFLKSVGEKPDNLLESFMANTLKLKNPLFSQKSRQVCCCKHIQSLWITLSLEKTKCLALYHRNAFESVGQELRVDLTDGQTKALKYFCDGLQIDKLDMLIECLFECLMFRLTLTQNPEDEDFVDVKEKSLKDYLMAYMDSPPYDQDVVYPAWMMEVLRKLPSDLEELQVRHAVAVWLCLHESYMRKDSERQR